MSAYLIFTREKTLDEAELKIYWDKIRATFAGHHVKVLVNYGRLEGLEGDPVEGYRDRGIPELRSGQGMVRTIISLGGIMTDSYPFTVFGDEFKGKRVLVTGGTKGIGEAVARRFALSGASVATTARSEAANGQDSALFKKADIGTARGVQNVVDCIQREWGGLDILVNNVGGTETKPGGFEVLSDEDWQRILEAILLAAVRLDRAFLPGMCDRTRE